MKCILFVLFSIKCMSKGGLANHYMLFYLFSFFFTSFWNQEFYYSQLVETAVQEEPAHYTSNH